MAAVTEVHYEADGQPDEQPQPIGPTQAGDQEKVGRNANDWNDRNPRSAEGTRQFGMRFSHDEDATANEHEGEQGADACHFADYLDRR